MEPVVRILLCAAALLCLGGCAADTASQQPVAVGVVSIDLEVDSLVLTTLAGKATGVPLSDGPAVLAALTRELGEPRLVATDGVGCGAGSVGEGAAIRGPGGSSSERGSGSSGGSGGAAASGGDRNGDGTGGATASGAAASNGLGVAYEFGSAVRVTRVAAGSTSATGAGGESVGGSAPAHPRNSASPRPQAHTTALPEALTPASTANADSEGPVAVRFQSRSIDDHDGHRIDLHGPDGLQVGDPAADPGPLLLEPVRADSPWGVVAGSDGEVVSWIATPTTVEASFGC